MCLICKYKFSKFSTVLSVFENFNVRRKIWKYFYKVACISPSIWFFFFFIVLRKIDLNELISNPTFSLSVKLNYPNITYNLYLGTNIQRIHNQSYSSGLIIGTNDFKNYLFETEWICNFLGKLFSEQIGVFSSCPIPTFISVPASKQKKRRVLFCIFYQMSI